MNLKRIIFFGLLLIPFISFGQTYTIKGVVTDEKGKPAPNAEVSVPGSGNSTTTNEAGEFILNNVPAGVTNLSVKTGKDKSAGQKIDSQMIMVVDSTKEDEMANSHADTEN